MSRKKTTLEPELDKTAAQARAAAPDLPAPEPAEFTVALAVGGAAASEGDGAVLGGFFSASATGERLEEIQARLLDSLKEFADRLGETLQKAIDDVSSLEVRTYVSDDVGSVTYEDGLLGGARLRAYTRIGFDQDTLVCVPEEDDGGIDEALWSIHSEMVRQAQASRTEMVKAVAAIASGLYSTLKG